MKARLIPVLLAFVVTAWPASLSAAAVDYFLKLEGIDGESTAIGRAGQVDVLSFSWGMTNSGSSPTGGGSGVGKVSVHDIVITKSMDKSTPLLMLKCATGVHLPKAELMLTKPNPDPKATQPLEYLKITMTDVVVTSYQTGGSSGSPMPVDSFSLNFTKVKVEYVPVDPKGIPQDIVSFEYSLNETTAE